METAETLVIGAGVVGLAVAAQLSHAGHEVFVCEKEKTAGSGVSARNSGVIHAGLYYPPDSLKSRFCLQGRDRLYAFCEARGIAYKKTGKLIVATDGNEEAKLKQIFENARLVGVDDLEQLDVAAVRTLEPALDVSAALLSPSTGIVDPAQFVAALESDLEAVGGAVAFASEVSAVQPVGEGPADSGFIVSFAGSVAESLFVRKLINCAGLGAQTVADCTVGLRPEFIPMLRMVRGHYFGLSGAAPFKHLIYPVPQPGGLGVHATLDTGGSIRFGPDVEPCDTADYRPDMARAASFQTAIARYYPGILDRELLPDFVGIRPQIGEFGAFNDFVISGEAEHGIKGLVNLFGIESPGLTASLAVADHVAGMMSQ